MKKEKQTTRPNEETKYYNEIPPEILENMTSEVRRQYFLWDEMLKRQIQLYPEMLLPLIKEIFRKEYPVGINIKMLSTEYVVSKVYEYGEKRIESVRSDLLIQVGSKDIYHMECQMKQGGDIAIRMLEYDMNIALVHGLEWVEIAQAGNTYKHRLKFPKSAILSKNTPDAESCVIVFPDETEYEYRIPILKIQKYTPEMIEEKNLNILLPFLPIRFKRKFESILKTKDNPIQFEKTLEKMEALKKDLTKLVADCIIIINREEENGTLSNATGADIVELMGKTCEYLFSKEPELLREVHEIMEPAIKLFSEELKEQKDAEFKLFSEKLIEEKDAEFKLFSEKLTEQKNAEFKLFSEKLTEQKDNEIKLLSERLIEQKEAEFRLV
ncbi:MAG: hypothetical protein K2N82_08645, partial [Lachnospiraceae bacterium]|nr:hypothetical protein [Lachnospiraceae bacterium]